MIIIFEILYNELQLLVQQSDQGNERGIIKLNCCELFKKMTSWNDIWGSNPPFLLALVQGISMGVIFYLLSDLEWFIIALKKCCRNWCCKIVVDAGTDNVCNVVVVGMEL